MFYFYKEIWYFLTYIRKILNYSMLPAFCDLTMLSSLLGVSVSEHHVLFTFIKVVFYISTIYIIAMHPSCHKYLTYITILVVVNKSYVDINVQQSSFLFYQIKGILKSKTIKCEIFLPVKELVLIDIYTPIIRFRSLSLFC